MKFGFFRTLLWIVSVGVVVFFCSVLFGDVLLARLSTLSVVKKYHLLEPSAPLVINTREEVRVNEANDIIAAINKNQEKVAAVVTGSGTGTVLRGAALASVSDGLWLTTKAVVAGVKPTDLVVVQNSGKRLPVSAVTQDTVSTLVLLRTDAKGLNVSAFREFKAAATGERVVLLGAQADGAIYFLTSYISAQEKFTGAVVASEAPSRSLLLQTVAGLMPGQIAFDFSGQVTGVYDGQSLVPASVAQEFVANVLANQGKLVRPYFGFFYTLTPDKGLVITKREAVAVAAGSPAARAGLVEGDVITKIGQQSVLGATPPDMMLQAVPVNAPILLTVMRQNKEIEVSVTPIPQKAQ